MEFFRVSEHSILLLLLLNVITTVQCTNANNVQNRSSVQSTEAAIKELTTNMLQLD